MLYRNKGAMFQAGGGVCARADWETSMTTAGITIRLPMLRILSKLFMDAFLHGVRVGMPPKLAAADAR
jgi:hypothetical protein